LSDLRSIGQGWRDAKATREHKASVRRDIEFFALMDEERQWMRKFDTERLESMERASLWCVAVLLGVTAAVLIWFAYAMTHTPT
jgi:hypothetical protein